jgi:hypothetical protein
VGWRQRDWARFNDEERKVFYGASSGRRARLPPSIEGREHTNVLRMPLRSRRRRETGVRRPFAAALFVVVTALAGLSLYAATHPSSDSGVSVAPNVPLPIPTPAPPTNVIGIHWSAADLAPAPNAGRICVTSDIHGRICASYVVGERPADTLTRRVESLGLRVQSDG